MNRKYLVAGVSAACLALAVALALWLAPPLFSGEPETGPQASGEAAGNTNRDAVPVELAEVSVGTAEERFATVGEVEAEARVEIAAERSGRVRRIPVEDGARVAAGQTLLQFDAASEEAALAAAEATLSEAEAAFQRARTLFGQGHVSEARLDDRRAVFQSAEAEVERAREALQDRRIAAPFAGEVGILEVSEGAYVAAGEPLVTLVTPDRLRVRLSVPQTVAEALQPGGILRLQRPDGRRVVNAAIDVIAATADEASRLVDVEAVLPEALAGLRPGTFVEVELVTETRENALFVPESALQWQGPQAHVYRVADGMTAESVPVDPGMRREGRVEVRSDRLQEQDRVVAAGLQKLRDGTTVTPQRQDAGAAPPAAAGRSAP